MYILPHAQTATTSQDTTRKNVTDYHACATGLVMARSARAVAHASRGHSARPQPRVELGAARHTFSHTFCADTRHARSAALTGDQLAGNNCLHAPCADSQHARSPRSNGINPQSERFCTRFARTFSTTLAGTVAGAFRADLILFTVDD